MFGPSKVPLPIEAKERKTGDADIVFGVPISFSRISGFPVPIFALRSGQPPQAGVNRRLQIRLARLDYPPRSLFSLLDLREQRVGFFPIQFGRFSNRPFREFVPFSGQEVLELLE